MKLVLPIEIIAEMREALAKAGQREIGGILMGEHIGPDTFRVKSMTIQFRGGTFAAFIRIVADILAPLRSFFETTQHNYKRFNYLGEWHSHHSFELSPSGQDHFSMNEIVIDKALGAHFVVLLLVKLDEQTLLDCSVTVYQPNIRHYRGIVEQECQRTIP
jgi:hypothetical protein